MLFFSIWTFYDFSWSDPNIRKRGNIAFIHISMEAVHHMGTEIAEMLPLRFLVDS